MENLNVKNGGTGNQGHSNKKFVFFIGKDKYETEETVLTPRRILTEYAKVDVKLNTLALKEEGSPKEYKDLDEKITMKDGMHFTVFNNEPTPIS
jgi:hypothetical protein